MRTQDEGTGLDPLKAVGETIRRQIALKGYPTVETFAHEHSISKGTLSKILNGKVDAKVTTLYRIALALGVGVTELLPHAIPDLRVMESPRASAYQVKRKKRKA